MDLSEYGCNESVDIKDGDSVVSETCWQENHRGDSRKWLVRDGYTKGTYKNLKSTMKATYPFPFQEEFQPVGERRARIMQKLYDEAADEIIRERDAPPPVEEYCTEYDGNYSQIKVVKGENDEEERKELYEKFPLYTSPAMSFWNFKIEKYQRGNATFPRLTTSVDLKNPFKRHSGFTKPITEVLDDCYL